MPIENLSTKADLKNWIEVEVLANSSQAVAIRQLQAATDYRGTGNPNGAQAGKPGDIYRDTSGVVGARLWFKETGTDTDTGWVSL